MAGGPPNIFFFLWLYNRYKTKFYEKQEPFSQKKPLGFGLWFLRFLGKFILFFVIPLGIIAGIVSLFQ